MHKSSLPLDQRTRESATETTLALAIIDPETPPAQSEFGWTLDADDAARCLLPLGDLLSQSGIRWVKFPFVCKSLNPESAATAKPPTKRPELDRMEPLINFSDRLADAGVQIVGVLHPPASAETGRPAGDLLAAEAFAADPKTWYPSVEPVLARLATEIRYWQIGEDGDPGWIGCRDLPAAIARIKTALDRIRQNLEVGMAWSINAPLPIAAAARGISDKDRLKPGLQLRQETGPPWRFLSLPCDDSLTDAELAARLDATASAASPDGWRSTRCRARATAPTTASHTSSAA